MTIGHLPAIVKPITLDLVVIHYDQLACVPHNGGQHYNSRGVCIFDASMGATSLYGGRDSGVRYMLNKAG